MPLILKTPLPLHPLLTLLKSLQTPIRTQVQTAFSMSWIMGQLAMVPLMTLMRSRRLGKKLVEWNLVLFGLLQAILS